MREAEINWVARIVTVDTRMTTEAYIGLEGIISDVEAALMPASTDDRMAALGELLTVFPMNDLGQGGNRVRWDVYHKALGDIPSDILQAACEAIAKTSKFFPKPAEIRTAADARWSHRIKILTKLRALRDFKVEVRGEGEISRTPDEIARVNRLVRTAFRRGDEASA